MRLCIDYCALNKKNIPDRHPIPRIQETLDNLGDKSQFSTLDQGKKCHQGFVEPNSQPLKAFITPRGLCERVNISFGLMNAPRVSNDTWKIVLAIYVTIYVYRTWTTSLYFLEHSISTWNIFVKCCVA